MVHEARKPTRQRDYMGKLISHLAAVPLCLVLVACGNDADGVTSGGHDDRQPVATYMPTGEGADAGLLEGTFVLRNGCLGVENGRHGESVVAAFAEGTFTWDNDAQQLTAGGATIGIGDRIALPGGAGDPDSATFPASCAVPRTVWFVGGGKFSS